MIHRYINILFTMIFCTTHIAAEDYTTLIHHKDGRVFAIASDKIDSITHIDGVLDDSYYDLTDSIIIPPYMYAITDILQKASLGVPDSLLCTEENIDALFSHNARFERAGEPWTHTAMFSFIDDDVIDEFIPSSYSGQSISNSDKKVGGYFSLLYPMIRSLEVKHNISLSCGLATEGHRIGLTRYWSESDECAINENGLLLKQLLKHTNWECLCHSMTARLSPEGSMYIVDSLNSTDAKNILKYGNWNGKYSFYTTGVYDRKTQKNYTISQDKNTWTETPLKYIQPYCMDNKTGKWIYNESYPLDYQIGEWKRRATYLGIPYSDIMVCWGSTASGRMFNKIREYIPNAIGSNMNKGVNNVPLSTSIHRIGTIHGNDNAFIKWYFELLKSAVDQAIETNGWIVFKSHFYLINYYNGYLDGVTYPEKEENYNPEWINPLLSEELQSMNENNYWDNPPTRLGIDNWGEWRPAKGTQLWGTYQILEYAILKHMQNVSPSEGFKIMGNKVNIGVYREYGLYNKEKKMDVNPIDKCYFVVGADGSIKYHSEK